MLDRLKIALQYLLPKYRLSQLAGWFAEQSAGPLTQILIRLFIGYYRINMEDAELPSPSSYNTFNEFFTRRLRPAARHFVDDNRWLASPVDGAVGQLGSIEKEYLLQAKGHNYQLDQLVAGDAELVDIFRDGRFASLYLSPRDYHRVHMPCDGLLRKMIYVPGDRFSVNGLTAAHVPNLFARNERVIAIFDTAFGPIAQILVGAAIVGSITVVWAGRVQSVTGDITHQVYSMTGVSSVRLKRGAEMGYFKLGSTVINLFAPNQILFADHLECCSTIKLGERYAQRVPTYSA